MNEEEVNPATSVDGNNTVKMDFFKVKWLQKLKVYKTHARLFVIGSDIAETKFRIIALDRNESSQLVIGEDNVEYNSKEVTNIIASLYDGNNTTGKKKKSSIEFFTAHGIVGFVRFKEGYYAIFITKHSKIAEIGSHSIYKIEETLMVYLPNSGSRVSHPDEARYLKMFQTVDLSSDFYFSYSYDLTNSLQQNMVQLLNSSDQLDSEKTFEKYDCDSNNPNISITSTSTSPCKRFVWNNYLIDHQVSDAFKSLWLLHVIHGHVAQSYINVYGQQIYITLIARRSSAYAGTRFIKRGCNIKGDVANEVETEQIVHCASISSLRHAPFTSFVQHRGSVPLHWEQDMSANVVPSKPPITITNNNPYAQATACHFRQLLERFGAPIIVLNLVRKRERRFRESVLGHVYECAIDYLNQFLKTSQQIKYFAIDMAQLSRGRKPTVIAKLADTAERVLLSTGFFQSKPNLFQDTLTQNSKWKNLGGLLVSGYRIQTGVLRTNCVDCLDRTNSAQFIVGKCALAYQLYSLGVLPEPDISFETDVIRLYEDMFEAHGDIIALQYGGSQLVHTIQSYRRTVAPLASHSRDIVTTISRYYTNAFSDADKQAAMNLFLGVFRPSESRDNLWDITTDHYLHNRDDDVLATFFARRYTRWWNPDVIRVLPLPFQLAKQRDILTTEGKATSETAKSERNVDWYNDLHNPFEITFFDDVFALKLDNTYSRFLSSGHNNPSPFVIRKDTRQDPNPPSEVLSPVPSLASLDYSSNDSSESDAADVEANHRNSNQLTNSSPHSPWLQSPTLQDFSPQEVYGIDLDSCTSKEDLERFEKYVACTDLDESISECNTDILLIEEPTVDYESLQLYKESVYHTYVPDRQFYEDYLANGGAV